MKPITDHTYCHPSFYSFIFEFPGGMHDFGGNGIKNYYFATKILNEEEIKPVFLRATKRNSNDSRLYVHEVFLESEIKQKASDPNWRYLFKPNLAKLSGTDLYKAILQNIHANKKADFYEGKKYKAGTPAKAYAYSVSGIEIDAGTLDHAIAGTIPSTKTSIHTSILLSGVSDDKVKH